MVHVASHPGKACEIALARGCFLPPCLSPLPFILILTFWFEGALLSALNLDGTE